MNQQLLCNQAVGLHQKGDLPEAERLCLRVLAAEPANFTACHLLGVIRAQQERNAEALELIGAALKINPDAAAALSNYGNVLKVLGRLEEALASYDKALAIRPAFAEALNGRGDALSRLKRFDEALASYDRALAIKPDFAKALNNRGHTLSGLERFDEALANYDKALAINPDYVDALNNRGDTLLGLKRFEEALTIYDKALAIKPDFAQALNNRGVALWNLKRFDEALASYDKALAINPDHAEALNNRGATLLDLKRPEEALASYDKALAIKPDYVDVLNNRSGLLCKLNRVEEGLATYVRSAERVYGPSADARPGNEADPPHKVRHDIEQRDYLAGGKAAGDAPDVATPFQLADGSRLATAAVNPLNAGHIAEQWKTNRPQIVVIDNLLTPEALDGLRRFCWGSTVWRKIYEDGYLGAMPEHGFACPLLAQIADELRTTFPTVFRAHPLCYLWGFKYDSQLSGINVHADFAAVNVNFWITPDDANLDPESGGLVVWDVAAPLDWDFKRYNNDPSAARDFLARNEAQKTTVPYRANRAVIFDSNLFHETDRMKFKAGYLNRRINITLLYGERGSESP